MGQVNLHKILTNFRSKKWANIFELLRFCAWKLPYSSCSRRRQPDAQIANNFARVANFFDKKANKNCNTFFLSESSKKFKIGVSKKNGYTTKMLARRPNFLDFSCKISIFWLTKIVRDIFSLKVSKNVGDVQKNVDGVRKNVGSEQKCWLIILKNAIIKV